jgi:dipeptidyl aminopeptidase/acylaminoacyl peptidase
LLPVAAQASVDCTSIALRPTKQISVTDKRAVTVEDLAAVRTIDSLSISPDRRRYAILVSQADAANNRYRRAWFSGSTGGGELTCLGDGGDVRPPARFTGHMPGELAGYGARWSPDGQWLAYVVYKDAQVQLWRSRTDGTAQEQLTSNAADVREFEWSEDGKALYFTVGITRAELRAWQQNRESEGYRLGEDFGQFTALLGPQSIRPPETELIQWTVTFDNRHERLATEAERAVFARMKSLSTGAADVSKLSAPDFPVPPVAQALGKSTWRVRSDPASRSSRVVATSSGTDAAAIRCAASECIGTIHKTWWSEDARKVLFWRGEGINARDNAFYAWTPANGKVTSITRFRDDELHLCAGAAQDRLICVRETALLPSHVTAIDLRSASMQLLADVNPEFRALRQGKVERFEWDTPEFAWNEPGGELAGLYPPRAYGYILYPPDFDPTRRYPVFIDAYTAVGFETMGAEHPLHAYGANGFIVIRAEGPMYARHIGMMRMYSVELDYPHITMLMESTVRALDAVAKRGLIDERRVGIGGVSHGTFVPLYMMQKHDRIAAISISSPYFSELQDYWSAPRLRDATVRSRGDQRQSSPWKGIDIADYVGTIEAPVLMQLAAHETFALVKLIRNLADAGKPYDTYVFPAEGHMKWQAAHLYAINRRNLDWFRFWLQDFEDSSPDKSEQYAGWRKLREQQQGARASMR